MTIRRTGAAVLVAFLSLIMVLAAGAVSGRVSARAGETVNVIDTFDRAAVAASYQRHVVDNFTVGASWNGSVPSCSAGSSTNAFDGATLESINWFRRMVGLPPVVEDATASSAAQRAALMMEAAGSLSHDPGPGWPCHSAQGAVAAGTSNLTLGISGVRGVLGQIEDPGVGNDVLGHRRWLLFPRLDEVGIGNTTRAGAVSVIGGFGARATGSEWVAWPPAGYVPGPTVYDRWSLSFNSARQADFSNARVQMTENGRPIPVRLLPLVNGYGDATLGWEPQGITPDRAADVLYEITVSNIVIGGVSRSHRYDVVAFDSTRVITGPAEVAAGERRCRGFVATIVGTDRADVITGTPGRDVIVGLDGADVINGMGGDDVICSGKGNDVVDGGDGDDTIIGGQGHDVLRGGSGADVINGQNGRDRLAGNQGEDLLVGGNHPDVLLGNTGTDSCWGFKLGAASPLRDDYRTCEVGRT